MENRDYVHELGSPPMYSDRGYEQLKEEMEFQNGSRQLKQTTVVTIMPEDPPVRDHIIWSLFNAMYLNFCCFGVLALVYSVKARDRKMLGDKHGSASYGSTARSLNIAATVLSILFTVVAIIIFVLQLAKAVEMFHEMAQKKMNNENSYFPNTGYGYGK